MKHESSQDDDLRGRLDRFAQTRNPRDLWPRLQSTAVTWAFQSIEQVARDVLSSNTGSLPPCDGDRLYALQVAGFFTGAGPLLGRWIEDGRVQAAQSARDVFLAQLDHSRRRGERMLEGSLRAFDRMLAGGITPVVIKGLHIATMYAEEPGVRPMSDIDVVAEPRDIDAAESALREAGFEPRSPRRTPYYRDWIEAAMDPAVYSVEWHDERSRWHLELHESFDRSFPYGEYARLDSERRYIGPLRIRGRELAAPVQPLLLLVLATQIGSELTTMRLLRVIDLVRVIRADLAAGRLDWRVVLAAFERTNAARFAYPGLALAEHLAPGTVDPAVLDVARAASSWGVRRTVSQLTPAGTLADHTSVVTSFMWARGARGVLKGIRREVVRLLSPGDEGAIRRRMLLRRVTAKGMSLRPKDEGT